MPFEVNFASQGLKNPAGYIEEVLAQVKSKNPVEPEFHQAVQEVLESLRPVLDKHPEFRSARFISRRAYQPAAPRQLRGRRAGG